MKSVNTNLTNPFDIVAAIKKKAGNKGVTALAKDVSMERANISMHIHKRRRTHHVLQAIANWLGCGVHGVLPDDPTRPGTAKESKG